MIKGSDKGSDSFRGCNFPDGYWAPTNPSTFSPSSTPGRSQRHIGIAASIYVKMFHGDELPYPGRENDIPKQSCVRRYISASTM
ncbi:hypothetical protein QE152_g25875 [Popillia japonica]|uniref:Uncharacterized protein n=1 Tax=Popillia japonica TaxID=7064 RepID=A0AAW1JZ37_POPJA